jgi:hypothetical protein
MRMNEKQKPFMLGGIVCGIAFAILVGFFPEAVNTNPILKTVAFILFIPTSIVSLWLLTEMIKSSSDR